MIKTGKILKYLKKGKLLKTLDAVTHEDRAQIGQLESYYHQLFEI
jgi:hypothetical protein